MHAAMIAYSAKAAMLKKRGSPREGEAVCSHPSYSPSSQWTSNNLLLFHNAHALHANGFMHP
jgi:hypothetical protein